MISNPKSDGRRRVLLGHLVSNGDCLYATTVARQIKADDPECHLTWAISSTCRPMIEGNPHVDSVWEIPLLGGLGSVDAWNRSVAAWEDFEVEAKHRKAVGDFHEIYFTQFNPGRLDRFNGTIRSTTFVGYPKPITVSVQPVLRLFPEEVENVSRFADKHLLSSNSNVILFECSPQSGQSPLNPSFALGTARELVAKFTDLSIILSSRVKIDTNHERILDGSALSLRENAELTRYCSLLIGGSSGVSWICTSDWAKPIAMVQVIDATSTWCPSFVRDHEQWGLSTDHIIEIDGEKSLCLSSCVAAILTQGFQEARREFHQRLPAPFTGYGTVLGILLKQRRYYRAAHFLFSNICRHGLDIRFLTRPRRRLWKRFSHFLLHKLSIFVRSF